MDINDLKQVDISQLPHSLQRLIDCVGVEHAYRLTCLYGGRPKYIPKHPQRTALAKSLPPEALARLIERFAGLALEIPKADHFCRQLRNRQIHEESSNGSSRSELADKYGLSLRQIGNIRRQENLAHDA
ncbi:MULTISPECIES: Mor transcription activator family protein [Pseudomonas]|uniref:Transcriptional regulator n=1 Tax=Pseudomonas eucalypticola TaxID=2599595 RepID=A0A7D5D6B3_9PSED|nr:MULTISPECIES: Mor transcription activator family protein [Pseudomonas]QKZ04294.1 transcriptional regulator [Pseudomonas eucalypticola]